VRSSLFLLALAVSTSTVVRSQVERGAIVGIVTDPSGGILAGAEILIRNTETNVSFKAVADSTGSYVALSLPAGIYEVTGRLVGFRQQSVQGIVVGVGQRVRADLSLQIGDVSEQISVVASAPLVQSESATVGTAIARQTIVDLPLNGRSFVDLLTLSSGITSGTPGRLLNGRGVQTARGSSSFSNNGMRDTSNNFLIDGIDNNDMAVGTITYYPSVDAILEFKVQTSASDAEFGRNGGGTVNLITKSGTNEFHGSAYEFLRNSDLNAKNFFVPAASPKPVLRRNQFGSSIGGPVVKNKLFFFGDYEGRRYTDGLTYVNTVPTPAQKMGNFTGFATIYDPSTYNAAAQTRQPFPGNQIGLNRISAISQFLERFYPDPNLPGKVSNFVYSPNQQTRGDQFDIKGDYYLSAKDNMFLRYSYSYFILHKPPQYPLIDIGSGGGGNANYDGNNIDPTQQLAYTYTHIFAPTLVNTVRLGFVRFIIKQTPTNFGKDLTAQAGIPGVNVSQETSGLMGVGISGYGSLGDSTFSPALLFQNNFNFQENVTWNHASHSLKAGLQIVRRQLNFFQANNPRGSMSFATNYTSLPSQPSNTGDAFATFLLGIPSSGNLTRLLGPYGVRYTEWAGFLKDDWKVLPNLTINFGLRYEFDTPFTEVHNRMSNLDFQTGRIIVAGTSGWPTGLVQSDTNNFGPRVGIAWSPSSSKRTVIRSGFGVFYNIEAPVTSTRLTENAPFLLSPAFTNDLFQPTYTINQGFPTATVDPNNPAGIGVNTWQKDFQDGRVMQWNFTVESEVARDLVVRSMYVASRGLHLFARGNRNQAVPGSTPVASRRPFPNLQNFNSVESRGNSTYESFQLQVERRLHHGLSLLSAFTWGKAIDDSPGGLNDYDSAGPTSPDNMRNIAAEKGLSDFNVGRRWVTSFGWELPFGRGKHFGAGWKPVLNGALGGWQVNGILSFQDGLPMTLAGPDQTNGSGSSRPDRIGNGNLPASQRTLTHWYDTAAFKTPALYTFGNAGRNIIFQPGLRNFDFSVFKTVAFNDRFHLQYRAEGFDLTNTPFFGPPNRSFYLPSGGVISVAYTQRILQMGLKLLF
jgi:carboxypeptidase family protein